MQLLLILKEKSVALVLRNEENVIDQEKWIDENDLLEKFFPILDMMLSRHDLDIVDVDDFLLETSIPKGYTTARIARTIIKTFNFARKS